MDQPVDRADVHKHLDFIENVIARLANNSFLIKGWAVAVAGAFYGFGIQQDDSALAILGLLPAVSFWWLDAYYLRSEQLFRRLFDAVRREPAAFYPFDMNHRAFESEVKSRAAVMWSETLRNFYVPLTLVGLLASLVVSNLPKKIIDCLANQ